MKHITAITKTVIWVVAAGCLLLSCRQRIERNEDILWYKQPAKSWEEALPLGNGRLGVMVFGKTSHEHIQLNDDSMWPADAGWDEPAGDKEDLEEIRKLLLEGKNVEADSLFVEKFSRKSILRSHQTLGDLFINIDHEGITNYRRELNISIAEASVSYRSNGYLVTENVFVSYPHQAIVVELISEAPEGLNGRITLSRPDDNGYPTATTRTSDGGLLVMEGEVTQREAVFDSEPSPILKGVKFETCLKIDHDKGEITTGEDYLELKEVKRAVLYLVSNSSYYFEDYSFQNEKDLQAVTKAGFNKIRKEHIGDYKQLYDRVDLSLAGQNPDSIPTDLRIERVKKDSTDTGLESLLFQYGRYLLISSSREGTNPANLQGLWNEHISAPWNADYHLNINLQMNYWPANLTNLGELNMPLFDYIDRLVENGKVTARKNFGCGGSFIPHATDIWAPTWLRAPTAYWGCSVGAGGWLMQHYWQHFQFTRDTLFLKARAYPAIREIAMFYSDWVIEDPRDGKLVSAPSTSPENRFLNSEGIPVATCLGSAMDQQIIGEVFENFLKASAILGIHDSLVDKIRYQKEKLRPGFVLGSDGRILEWDREYKEFEPGHRHISHLYGFHPGNSFFENRSPGMFEAVRKTLDYRLKNGGAGPGWSRAWLINCSARLLDGEMAHDNIRLFIQRSLYPNLFDAHPPFQIDGNFGYTAGVAEMLLQSHEEGILRILPALPQQWKTGSVRGLRARNGLTVDIFWKDHDLRKAIIHSEFENTIKLVYRDDTMLITLESGQEYIYTP